MIGIGCDHGGYELKEEVLRFLQEKEMPYKDFGCYNKEAVDYPCVGKAVGESVANGTCEKGIVICTTGIGISIAANKVHGVRAALCGDVVSAKLTRLHNDANVLALGAGIIGKHVALEILDTFLTTEFSKEERHARRVCQIEA